MDADFSVELGADDPCLELPWADPEARVAYFDLKRSPQLIDAIPEAAAYPALRDALAVLNESTSPFETAKSDVWASNELTEEEEIHGMPWKFGGYVDLLFTDERRDSFSGHEKFARDAVRELRMVAVEHASVELVVRRLIEQERDSNAYYFTVYVFGFGDDEQAAQQAWAEALPRVVTTLMRQAETGAGR